MFKKQYIEIISKTTVYEHCDNGIKQTCGRTTLEILSINPT
jgi:hypothetical protein